MAQEKSWLSATKDKQEELKAKLRGEVYKKPQEKNFQTSELNHVEYL